MIRPAEPKDVEAIVDMVRELADYEHSLNEVEMTADGLRSFLFAENPAVFAHVSEADGEVVGFALWFLSFSTWTGTHGIYLEDLYVKPDIRGGGHGKALMQALAAICVDRGYDRFEWSVLDWNEPAINVYKRVGAVPMDEWTRYRITGSALNELASS